MKPNQQLLVAAVVAILILLVLNVFLLYTKFKQDKTIKTQRTELDEVTRLKSELEKQYFESLAELEGLRGTNEELNTLIEQQKQELLQQKQKIEELIGNKRDLIKAREEMQRMQQQVEEYKQRIAELERINRELARKNEELEKTAAELQQTVNQERSKAAEILATRAQLEAEKKRFEEEKRQLLRQVRRASVVMVKQLEVTPLKVRRSGKPVARKRAKDIDMLKVCFVTTRVDATLVQPGPERFYVRIVSPVGETLGADDEGAGTIRRGDTNEEVRFTQAIDYQYQNDEAELCLIYEPPATLSPGIYTVQVYNKGYLAGETEFTLK